MEGNSVPPNYNPNDSLLKGGDSVPITPVQGGGAMMGNVPPPSYNPNETLLNGGDSVPIVAVRGGANNENNTESVASSKEDSANENNTVTLASETTENSGSTASNSNNNNRSNAYSEISSVTNENDESKDGSEDNEESKDGSEDNEESKDGSEDNEESKDGSEDNEESKDGSENNENEGGDEVGSKAAGKKEDEACEPPEDTSALDALDDTFVMSDDAVEENIKTTVIKIRAIDYAIRVPERDTSIPPEEYTDPVYSNWKQTKFTQGETELLNSLELSPKLLYLTFHCLDKDWKLELAEFLYFLAVDACWPTLTTVTHAKCRGVREFLALVNAQICTEKLRKLEREKGKPSIPEGVFLPRINTEQNENDEGNGNNENDEEPPKNENDEEPPKNENDEEPPKDENEENDDTILTDLSGNIHSLDDGEEENTDGVLDAMKKKIPSKKRTEEFFKKLVNKFKLKETTPWVQSLKKKVFGSTTENDETDDEIFKKIIRQIELVQKGNLGREILLRNIAKDLPEQYQTKEFMNRLVQEAIIDPKEPWYKRLKKKFFGRGGGERKTLRKLRTRTRKAAKKNLQTK